MKAVAVSIWIFINLILIGMCGYIYLLWSQYWLYVERQHHQSGAIVTNNNNGYISNNQFVYLQRTASGVHSLDKNDYKNKTSLLPSFKRQSSVTVRKDSHPRFPKPRKEDTVSSILKCHKDTGCAMVVEEPIGNSKLSAKIAAHKNQLVVQLRRVLLEESSVFKARGIGNNPYNVQYTGARSTYAGKSVKELVCELQAKTSVQTLSQDDEPFKSLGLGEMFPETKLFDDSKVYDSCGIVTNAGSLYGANLGQFIDSHDVVMRFNHAPTEGYESDVGTKTTIRIVNSQVVTKSSFNFLNSSLYKDIKLLAWDPSNYTSSLADWFRDPDFDVFTPYFKHRQLYPTAEFHLLDPRSQWLIWNYIQRHIPARIRKNPPSSGFLGLVLLLPHCLNVDLFEYVPSLRMTKRCHYWDVAEDSSCTFGVWHPLSAEKILTLALNVVPDEAVFEDGYVRVPGYKTLEC